MVFVFFGLVAVVGTTYVQTEDARPGAALYAAVGIGALACAILVVNNLRDIPTDTVAGKRTLAVVLGDDRTRALYLLLVLAAAAAVVAVAVSTTWYGTGRAGLPGGGGARRPDGAGRRHRAGAGAGAAVDRAGRAGLGGARRGAAVAGRLTRRPSRPAARDPATYAGA